MFRADPATAAAVTPSLGARGLGPPVSVLGDWHIALRADELAQFALAFPAPRYEVRGPLVRAVNFVNPLLHLAEGFRGVLIGGPVAVHLGALVLLVAVMLAVLVPLDLRLLRRRVLGERDPGGPAVA